MQTALLPIQTKYAGCLFRSRLEARWAVFFDHVGVTWRYEPEGFDLDGDWYLPDFYLPEIEKWFEVKGTKPTDHEGELARKLAISHRNDVIVAWGDIPRITDSKGMDDQSWDVVSREAPGQRDLVCYNYDSGSAFWDFWYGWCICVHCGKPGIEYESRSARICKHDASDRDHTGDHPRLLAAYTAARSARFEHGHTGAH